MKKQILFLLVLVMILPGCAAVMSDFKGENPGKEAYQDGYREGVRENLKMFKENFVDNEVPYYYWQSPIVQKVLIPAQITNGLFIPAHFEYVVIEPGAWENYYPYPIAGGGRSFQ